MEVVEGIDKGCAKVLKKENFFFIRASQNAKEKLCLRDNESMNIMALTKSFIWCAIR